MKIGFQCVWLEEIYTVNLVQKSFNDIWFEVMKGEFTSPLFYWIEHAIGLVLGYDAIAMRLFPAICGILCIILMFYLGREYLNEEVGLWCAGIVAVLFPLVYYSQYARVYTLSFVFFIIYLIYYIRIYRGDTSRKNLLIFGVFGGLNVWAHMFAIIPVTLLGLDLLISKRIWISIGVFFISLCPLIQMPITLFTQRVGGVLGYGMSVYEMIVLTPMEFYNYCAAIIAYLSLRSFLDEGDLMITKMMIISLITIGIGICLAPFTPSFPRYYLTVSFIITLFAGLGLYRFIEKYKDWQKVSFMVGVITVLLILQSSAFYTYFHFQKYVC
jgi:uncharacterized membrane protein